MLAAIDAAIAEDPTLDGAEAAPAALVYGRRMSAELARPDAMAKIFRP